MEDAQGPQKSWLSNRVPRRRSRAASVLLVPPRREGLSRCERRLPGVQMMSSTESGGGGMAEAINAATGACLRACVRGRKDGCRRPYRVDGGGAAGAGEVGARGPDGAEAIK